MNGNARDDKISIIENRVLKALLSFTAFGELRAAYSNDLEKPTDYRYTGQREEEESGLYYANCAPPSGFCERGPDPGNGRHIWRP